MPACCSTFERAAEQLFNEKKAAETEALPDEGSGTDDALASGGHRPNRSVERGATRCRFGSRLFDLWAAGARHHPRGRRRCTSAYNDVARQEAERLRRAHAVQLIHADFASAASELPSATLVTLDRVVCCYPSYEPLLNAVLGHADQCLALSYPLDVRYVRLKELLPDFRASSCEDGRDDSAGRI
jgi:hypothetical protein